jgi:hypothetical protein
MLDGGYRGPLLVRLTLSCTLVFLALLWFSNVLLYFQHMSLDPASVARYYLGSEEEFSAPRSYGSMLEVAHAHFAMMALVLLLVTHLAIFIPWPLRIRVGLVILTFVGALCEELGGWLVRFASPAWAWIKVAGFLALQAGLGTLLVGLAVHLNRRPPGPADRDLTSRAQRWQPGQ